MQAVDQKPECRLEWPKNNAQINTKICHKKQLRHSGDWLELVCTGGWKSTGCCGVYSEGEESGSLLAVDSLVAREPGLGWAGLEDKLEESKGRGANTLEQSSCIDEWSPEAWIGSGIVTLERLSLLAPEGNPLSPEFPVGVWGCEGPSVSVWGGGESAAWGAWEARSGYKSCRDCVSNGEVGVASVRVGVDSREVVLGKDSMSTAMCCSRGGASGNAWAALLSSSSE